MPDFPDAAVSQALLYCATFIYLAHMAMAFADRIWLRSTVVDMYTQFGGGIGAMVNRILAAPPNAVAAAAAAAAQPRAGGH